ncbi:MAG: peptidoglycan-binding protein, partial [Traorella sp.]
MPTGTLQIFTNVANEALALSNVIIRIFKEVKGEVVFEQYYLTDLEGQSPIVSLETKSRDLSLEESNSLRPYEVYSAELMLQGYLSELIQGIQIFEGEASTIQMNMIPDILVNYELEVDTIPDHHLLTNYGGNNVSQSPTRILGGVDEQDWRFFENDIVTPERIQFVQKGVVIPRQIRVHLGRPSASAENITVDFIYYIKNVCSSEVYPTWPKEALLANIHAQVSLALNRVYTEWYPSKGYDFDITNNTAYDQAFVKNRNIYDSISDLVDDVFNQFLRKRNFAEPFYAEYCDGKIAQCPGMKQWGTLELANQGMDALSILQYYYTDEVRLVASERIEDVKGSYPGTPLRVGSQGSAVFLIQQQLNAISVNYPLIKPLYPVDGIFDSQMEESVKVFQKQFNLTQDGIVGKSTWYKINYIYVAVRKLAELGSIGRVENELSGEWPQVILRYGDRSVYVQQLQFYLSTIALYNNAISMISTIDSFFGEQTERAVSS